MKNISLIGVGKLGLCFSLTLERSGYNVIGVDVNEEYVRLLNDRSIKSSEKNVEKYLKESKNFEATTSLEAALKHSDILFVLVATPSLSNGRYDHSQIEELVDNLQTLGIQTKEKHFIICCTTMPEYCDSVQQRLKPYNYTVSYNPEFIAQGTILRDQASPDMILIGEGTKKAGDLIQEIYKKITLNTPIVCRMSRVEAEICKLSLNCFLTTKIAYANMIGDIVKRSNGRSEVVLKAIGSDSRIGNKYLRYGFGYGGPCFPRDNRALTIFAQDKGLAAPLSKASDYSNSLHLQFQIEEFCKTNEKGKTVIFDTITYKPESTIIEESQQLAFAIGVAQRGYTVLIRERKEVIHQLKKIYGELFQYET